MFSLKIIAKLFSQLLGVFNENFILFVVFFCTMVNQAYAACELRVDSVQTLYVNGMFTKTRAAEFNTNSIEDFIREHLKRC